MDGSDVAVQNSTQKAPPGASLILGQRPVGPKLTILSIQKSQN